MASISYESIKSESSKPKSQRNKVLSGKENKKVIPRRYHLSSEELNELKSLEIKTGKFQNPYNKSGIYYYFIEALIQLGTDINHDFLTIKNKIKELMSKDIDKKTGLTKWNVFSNKECSWDANKRIYETALILSRISGGLNVFGYKLSELGGMIEFSKSTNQIIKKDNIMLKTGFNSIEEILEYKENKKIQKLEMELYKKD